MWAFENWTDFWFMGGYAGYVWSSVGLTVIVFIMQLGYAIKQHNITKRCLREALKREKE